MARNWDFRKRELFISAIFFMTMFGYDLISPFMTIFMKESGLGLAEVGIAYGMLPLVTIFLAGFVGHISDRVGRVRPLSIGVLLYCAFIIISSFSRSFPAFVVAYIILGIGNSLFWVCGRSYTLDIGPDALKYFYFAMLTGSLSGSVTGGFLIRSFGYQSAFYTSAAVVFAGFILGLTQRGRDCGCPNGGKASAEEKDTRKIILSRPVLLLAAMVTFSLFFASVGSIYLPLYLREAVGFDEAQIGILIATIALSWAVWQLLAGKIIEKTSISVGIGTGYVIMGISTFGLTISHAFGILAAAGASWTAGRAFFDQGASMHMDKIFKTRKGLGSAVIEIASNIGGFLASVVGGLLIATIGYTSLLVACALCLLGGTIFALTARGEKMERPSGAKQEKAAGNK